MQKRLKSLLIKCLALRDKGNIMTNNFLEWTPDYIYTEIIRKNSESNMPKLRKMILIAENMGFTVEQSKKLSSCLLNFAKKYRNSQDAQDESVVYSAIRTGASMLRPNDIHKLYDLLKPGYSIETVLVTVKMIGRIYEVQPPKSLNSCNNDVANKIYDIAYTLLNKYVLISSQSTALAQLSIFALAAMGDTRLQEVVEIAKVIAPIWFGSQMCKSFCELKYKWTIIPAIIIEDHKLLIDEVISIFEREAD